MKFGNISRSIIFTFLPVSTMAFADHNGDVNFVHQLRYDTQALNSAVQNSYLQYAVKGSVSQFSYAIDRFDNCVGSWVPPVIGTLDHNYDYCSNFIQVVRTSWYPVDRYLYDTYYDQPYIYNAYVRVRNDLSVMGLL